MLGERPRMLDGDFSNYIADAEQLSKGWGGSRRLSVRRCS